MQAIRGRTAETTLAKESEERGPQVKIPNANPLAAFKIGANITVGILSLKIAFAVTPFLPWSIFLCVLAAFWFSAAVNVFMRWLAGQE